MSAVEEKVDALGRALEQLLSRRECMQCGVCSMHAQLQEEQARRLEAMEQVILAIHAVLQGPSGSVADKRWPLAGREGPTKFGVQAGPRKDLSCRMTSTLGVQLGTPSGEGKEPLFNLVRSRTQAFTQRDAQTPIKKGSRVIGQAAQQSDEGDKVDGKVQRAHKTGKNTQEQEEPKCSTTTLVTKASPPRADPTKRDEVSMRTENTRSGKRRKSLTQTKSGSRDGKEKQTDREGVQVSVCPGEKPQTLSSTDRTLSGDALTGLKANRGPLSPSTLAAIATEPEKLKAPHPPPENLLELTVPEVTNEVSTLRHVSSCPVSLQRLEDPETLSSEGVPPLVKLGDTAVGATTPKRKHSAASSIQIQISPAPTNQARPKSPPQICCKVIDDDPPLPAPFPHRVVSLRPSRPCDSFSINTQTVLGGGRFGQVHSCTERTSGLKLAAKIITTRNAKEKEIALNEIQVMNQLNHANILQLYDAYEARNEVVLILEYVEGGELFERIVNESSPLTELDAMIYVKQICQGIQYMHQMYVLHLDLKPENILCVNRTGYQVKIIDFGLARRYKPREKLRVSFGTPEFLAPEIVNFDFVSFPTDMWTLGVVTYMLLSGLSPFLGDDDGETLNNILTGNWYIDEEAFEHVSEEAKDFFSNLLIREKSGRLSATQCLKHPWLNNISEKAKRCNIVLKSQVRLKKYMARRLWKKNYIAVAAANRFKKMGSSGSLTTLGI